MDIPYVFIQKITENIPDIPENSIISQAVYKDEKTEITLFGFSAGQELSEHTSAFPAVVHAIHGEAALSLGDEWFEMQENSWVFMQPHLPHSLKAKNAFVMLLTLFK